MANWARPEDKKNLRSFLGLCSYYRSFIKDFSTIAKPLSSMSSPNVKFTWTNECTEAFNTLKSMLVSAPILGHVKGDGEFILDSDASDFGLGGVVSQIQDGKEVVIAYGSRTLTDEESRYCVCRKELLAIVHHIHLFEPYLILKHFTVRTDHHSLKYLQKFKVQNGQMARWLDFLQSFDFEIIYRKGDKNGNADAMSRQGHHCGGKKCYCKQLADLQYEPPVVLESKTVAEAAVQTGDQDDPIHMGKKVSEEVLVRAVSIFPYWTVDQMKADQLADPDISIVLKPFEAGELKPKWETVSHLSAKAKILISEWDRLEIKNGLLYRKWFSKHGKVYWLQLVLPSKHWDGILEQVHDAVSGCHVGTNKTILKMRTRFWFPGMSSFTRRWVQSCHICQKRKSPTKHAKNPMKSYLVGAPGERICSDIIGPFTETDEGFRWILVFADYFTKYCVAVPVKDITAATISEKLVSNWICYFGCPKELHSDRGPCYESSIFQNVCKLLGIHKTRTTAGRPQSDGLAENVNKTLQNMLVCMAEDNPFGWHKLIRLCCYAYNSSVQDSSMETPAMMMFGRELTLPVDLITPLPESNPSMPLNESEFVLDLQKRLQVTHDRARHCQQKATLRQQKYYNNRLKLNSFQRGDVVLYHRLPKRKVAKEKKLPFHGPFVVLREILRLCVYDPSICKIKTPNCKP